jgi:AcrR family transcriptional regulator
MSRPKDELKVQRICEACMHLVLQTGFNSLRMADVAKEAGIATGTLYIYFPDKQSLVIEVFRRTKKQLAEALFQFTPEGNDFFSIFRSWWFNYFRYVNEFPHRMLFTEQFLHSGFIPREVIQESDQLFLPLDQFLFEARQAGMLINLDTEVIKVQLMGPIHNFINLSQKHPELHGEQSIEGIFRMAWQSIQP